MKPSEWHGKGAHFHPRDFTMAVAECTDRTEPDEDGCAVWKKAGHCGSKPTFMFKKFDSPSTSPSSHIDWFLGVIGMGR